MTRIELAKKGIITDEVKEVAKEEGLTPEDLSKNIAEGKVVITKNILRNIKPLGIGLGLRTKINANIGTSKDKIDIEEELEKLKTWFKRVEKRDFVNAPLKKQAMDKLKKCTRLFEEFSKRVYKEAQKE